MQFYGEGDVGHVPSDQKKPRQIRALCDSCHAEFALDLALLGQTVQCGQCRNYFVVTPASLNHWSLQHENGLSGLRVQFRFHLFPRAVLEDWRGQQWEVRYPVRWAEILHSLLALTVIIIALALITIGFWFFAGLVAARNPAGALPCLAFVTPMVCALYPLFLWQKASLPRLRTCIYPAGDRPVRQAMVVIQPRSLLDWILVGRWHIETGQGEVLAKLVRRYWVIRLLTRRRWTVQIPGMQCRFIIEETFWLPPLLRWLLLLPLGLLRLVFFLTP